MNDRLIRVSDYVYEELDKIKRKQQHKSFDSVIRYLLFVYREWRRGCNEDNVAVR